MYTIPSQGLKNTPLSHVEIVNIRFLCGSKIIQTEILVKKVFMLVVGLGLACKSMSL